MKEVYFLQKTQKEIRIFLFLLIFAFQSHGQTLYFPPLAGDTWETIDPQILGYCQPAINELNAYLDQTNSKAFILLKDGKMVFEWYFDTFTKDSFYVWNSAGKTLTAFAVGIAQEDGYLSIDDTTSQYLGTGWTSLTPQQEEKITIRHQLTMTSGLNHTGDHYCTDPACLVYEAEPGTRWMYHNGPYTLLDQVIEAATGMNLNLYVQQKIRQKIGMNGLFYPVGYNNVHISNARSMARFGLLMLANGTWNGTTVLADQNYFQEMTNSSQLLNPAYGYLTWLNGKGSYMLPSPDIQLTIQEDPLPNAPSDLYAALGKDGQIINVVPSQNLVVVRMGENDGNSLVGNQYNDTIWQKINQLICLSTPTQSLDKLQFFPNPSQGMLHSTVPITSFKVVDVFGSMVFETRNTQTVDLNPLKDGMYIAVYELNGNEYYEKIILKR